MRSRVESVSIVQCNSLLYTVQAQAFYRILFSDPINKYAGTGHVQFSTADAVDEAGKSILSISDLER